MAFSKLKLFYRALDRHQGEENLELYLVSSFILLFYYIFNRFITVLNFTLKDLAELVSGAPHQAVPLQVHQDLQLL